MRSADKSELRSHYRKLRAALGDGQREEQEYGVLAQLKALAKSETPQRVHCYVSCGDELNTRSWIEHCWSVGIEVLCPKVCGRGQLSHHVVKQWDDFETGAYGLLEPKAEGELALKNHELDWVLVPGLAFTASGQRLGYGGGYYDRFLPQVKGAKSIALSFREQVREADLPREDHDWLCDEVLTPDGFLKSPEVE